jgi:tetratricopeptide (TPR) repeat protein
MSVITAEQRISECDALMDAAVAARHDDEALVDALRACVNHPCAYHEMDLPELDHDLGEALARLNRYDESLEALESGIAAGERGHPHPRTNVAEVLLQAGRRPEADVLIDALRQKCPEDIWLYNAAGFSYAEVGEHGAALPWLEEGIALALADGDAERILGQLNEQRHRSREALGLGDDELTARVAAFVAPESPRVSGWGRRNFESFGEAHPDRSPCSHCGWDLEYEGPTELNLNELERLAESFAHGRGQVAHDPQPPLRIVKVGRNAPCPCGSGRKHKHCCGR